MKKYLIIYILALLIVTLFSCGVDYNDAYLPEVAKEGESDRTIITLGVINTIPHYEVDYTMHYVLGFNAENDCYRIEVVNYAGDDLIRLRTELLSGRGPDILYSLYFNSHILSPLLNRGMLVDLIPYIDTDPDISRKDFFQNILESMQSPDGCLQLVANQFWIYTLISIPKIVDDLDAFTTTKFLELTQSALNNGIDYPFGEYWTRNEFLNFMFSQVDIGIIDLGNGVSNIESSMFYDILELASFLPEEFAPESGYSRSARIIRGEQFFEFERLENPYTFSKYETLLGDFVILGIPSNNGGVHGAFMRSNIAINASSDHKDAAWDFVRRYLLRDAKVVDNREIPTGLPIRIDLFNEQVEEAMKREWVLVDNGIQIEMRPQTVEGASKLRELIDNISYISRPNEEIANMIMEEIAHFFEGRRTKEEVARVLQNRVQIYLHERN